MNSEDWENMAAGWVAGVIMTAPRQREDARIIGAKPGAIKIQIYGENFTVSLTHDGKAEDVEPSVV
jgi:hypothetical protein